MQQKPENFFCTKHVLSVVGIFFISTASPFIEKVIDTGVSKKEIMRFVNTTLVALLAAGTKAYDPYVYTPKYIIGRDKKDVQDMV